MGASYWRKKLLPEKWKNNFMVLIEQHHHFNENIDFH